MTLKPLVHIGQIAQRNILNTGQLGREENNPIKVGLFFEINPEEILQNVHLSVHPSHPQTHSPVGRRGVSKAVAVTLLGVPAEGV